MTLYETYKKNPFSLAPFGIEKGDTRSDYFCTPRGAVILGWTGVDGIHYCMLKSHGETVFAVNPMADPKKHAFPVAENFEGFLRLLITCHHEAVLEQAHAWTREQYAQFLADNPITPEQKSAADSLAAQFGLTPVGDPYAELKEIYDAFDFDTVPYKKDYYEWVPVEEKPVKREWKVYYSTCGETGEKRERAGRELALGASFRFDGHDWTAPAAYVCRDGIVLDLFCEIPSEEIRSFHERWTNPANGEDAETIARQNPFGMTFSSVLTVNGREHINRRGQWGQYVSIPELREQYNTGGMEEALAHYGLSPEECWMQCRLAFAWADGVKPKIRSLALCLTKKPTAIPGPCFTVERVGQVIPFTHPITKTEHTLTVLAYQDGELEQTETGGWILPPHYTELTGRVDPPIPAANLKIRDVRQNDPVKRSKIDRDGWEGAASVGIIGGADGPTAVVISRPKPSDTGTDHTAVSAMTYEKQERVEWRLTFFEVLSRDAHAVLLP